MAVGSLKRSSIAAYTKYDSMLAGNAFTPTTFDYELLATTVLSSSQASVTLTLPSNAATEYKHLQIRMVTRDNRGDTGANNLRAYFNSDQGANYSHHRLAGNGSSVNSYASASQTYFMAGVSAMNGSAANVFAGTVLDILDFASTTKAKTMRSLSGETTNPWLVLSSGAWYSTAAITSVTFFPESTATAIFAGSRFSIYGVKG